MDLLAHLDKIAAFTIEGRDSFIGDEKTQLAVIRAYKVIGEIAKRLPAEVRTTSYQIDWRRLIGFRDFLAHNYDEIILEFVWEAVSDIPSLRSSVQALVDSLDTTGNEQNRAE